MEDKESIAVPHPHASSSFSEDLRLAPGALRARTRDDGGPGSAPPCGTGVILPLILFPLCKNPTTINPNIAENKSNYWDCVCSFLVESLPNTLGLINSKSAVDLFHTYPSVNQPLLISRELLAVPALESEAHTQTELNPSRLSSPNSFLYSNHRAGHMAYLGDNASKSHPTKGRVHAQLSMEPLEATVYLLLKHLGPQSHAESFIYPHLQLEGS